ncbi:MAG TPA: hypothetical protein VFJ51_14500, partial [Nitrososphaeraceae archaeon]|nr:hypothetical protein [Nitrososphaeraceae archaeon]
AMPHRRVKQLPTIRNIPDDLWNEIKLILPPEKPNKTIGRPVVPFRKVSCTRLFSLLYYCLQEDNFGIGSKSN